MTSGNMRMHAFAEKAPEVWEAGSGRQYHINPKPRSVWARSGPVGGPEVVLATLSPSSSVTVVQQWPAISPPRSSDLPNLRLRICRRRDCCRFNMGLTPIESFPSLSFTPELELMNDAVHREGHFYGCICFRRHRWPRLAYNIPAQVHPVFR